jgi:hypothetical protein
VRGTENIEGLAWQAGDANFGKSGECMDDDVRELITNTLIGFLLSSFVIWFWEVFYRLN